MDGKPVIRVISAYGAYYRENGAIGLRVTALGKTATRPVLAGGAYAVGVFVFRYFWYI